MSLNNEERKAIVECQLEKADIALNEAKGNLAMKFWYAAANRLYYACYYAVSGLLIQNGFTAHTHTGMINVLGQHFVTKGLITKEENRFYSRLFELRLTGDYTPHARIGESEITPFFEPAEAFIEKIKWLILNP